MKSRTVIQSIGENVGPIDWSYDFRQHFTYYAPSDAGIDELCSRAVERLRLLTNGEEWEAATFNSFDKVIDVGMYDGWPYWRPVPSFATFNFLGVEWHPFFCLSGIRRVSDRSEIL